MRVFQIASLTVFALLGLVGVSNAAEDVLPSGQDLTCHRFSGYPSSSDERIVVSQEEYGLLLKFTYMEFDRVVLSYTGVPTKLEQNGVTSYTVGAATYVIGRVGGSYITSVGPIMRSTDTTVTFRCP